VELDYSLYLSANILKFYDYDTKTFLNFFNDIGDKHFCPILVWEYIILRTQLFVHLDKVVNSVGPTNFHIDKNNKNSVVDTMKIDNNLINELSFFMQNTRPIKNISYTMIDFNWNLL
jgi:hypothetical protein